MDHLTAKKLLGANRANLSSSCLRANAPPGSPRLRHVNRPANNGGGGGHHSPRLSLRGFSFVGPSNSNSATATPSGTPAHSPGPVQRARSFSVEAKEKGEAVPLLSSPNGKPGTNVNVVGPNKLPSIEKTVV